MNQFEQINFLRDYFSADRITGSIEEFILDTFLLILLSLTASFIYIKFANSLSNRKKFSSIFPLLALTTMMIISIIRSSLALSLGLVGALSIIRFRSAIKEPEELAYLFFVISLGLGFGAGQREVTLIFFIIIALMIVLKNLFKNRFSLFNNQSDQNIYLNISSQNKQIDLEKIINILDKDCHFIDLKRFNEKSKEKEFLFLIKTKEIKNLTNIKNNILNLDHEAEINILNDEGLFN